MGKNVRLADIYIKIYNKRTLTMEDLTFLSKYDPECFAKTCQNLIYNIPETKKLMHQEEKTEEKPKELPAERREITMGVKVPLKKENMEQLLENLRKMEMKEISVQEVKAEKVKNLLGSLYMEMLFPHNDKDQYFEMEERNGSSIFNKKV